MLDPWNDSSLLPPPVQTLASKTTLDADGLLCICKEMCRILSKQSPLHKESAIISRFIYKFDRKFRNDIGFRSFKKVNTALRRYLLLNFTKDIDYFTSALPSNESDDFYLPTRQMLEYLLVRLQTFSKIMLRVCVCSKQAAVFYLDRIRRGESHWMSLMPYASLCRIWSISSILINHACQWYNSLISYHSKLQSKGLKFLGEGYELSKDLRDWLDVKNLDNLGRYEWAENKSIQVMPILGDIDDTDTFDIFKYVNEINDVKTVESDIEPISDAQDVIEIANKTGGIITDKGESISRDTFASLQKDLKKEKQEMIDGSDQGEIISRDTFKQLPTQQNNIVIEEKKDPIAIQSKKEHCIDKITSSESLKKFLKTEEKYRNEENKDSLTSHLSFMQWQALKGTLLKLTDSLANNRKVQRKFQKIWKEKCLDYL